MDPETLGAREKLQLSLGAQIMCGQTGSGFFLAPILSEGVRVMMGHGQLTEFLSPVDLFQDYLYASSTSQTLRQYSKHFAKALATVFTGEGRILEIASNDGVLLRELSAQGLTAIGVDPAHEMVRRSNDEGLTAICDFWPSPNFKGQKFNLIVGQNVLAHTPSPMNFLVEVFDKLDEDGLAVFQTSQADMVANGEFDTIYHEHFSFFSERSASHLAVRAGGVLLETAYTSIHGNSATYIFSKTSSSKDRAIRLRLQLQEDFHSLPRSKKHFALRKNRSVSNWLEF